MANAQTPVMKRSSAAFLQAVVVLIALGAAALLITEPYLEGRNEHATNFAIYFKDPFLAYAYAGSIPFFAALYQAFKLLGHVRHNTVFSPAAVRSLRLIKISAIAIIGFVIGAEVFILLHESDDRAGGVFIGILITVGSVIIAAAAATFEWILQNAVHLKSENELTV